MKIDTADTADTTGTKGDGNTSSSPRSRHWCFTLNNWTEEEKTQLTLEFTKACQKFVFQPEVGESGTPHLQGVISFKNARRLSSLKKFNARIHWERCRNVEASYDYCQKEDTKVGDAISHNLPRKLIDPIVKLRKWQQKLRTIYEGEPDNRSIYWILDIVGGAGKTVMCKHICMNRKDAIYLTGKAADMKYAVYQMIKAGKEVNIVLLDFTRSTENYCSWQGIEEIKNGIFFNNKYESGMCIFNPPHVICFANWMYDPDKLSKDRWVLIDLADANEDSEESEETVEGDLEDSFESFEESFDSLIEGEEKNKRELEEDEEWSED